MAERIVVEPAVNGTERGTAREGTRGFTLIEMAIVLVIFGIVLTGILAGARVIQNARTSQMLQDLTILSGAITTYQERYGQMPGSDSLALSRFGERVGNTGFTITNGNGTDRLNPDVAFNAPQASENSGWQATLHLRSANLLQRLPRNVTAGTNDVYLRNPFESIYSFAQNPFRAPSGLEMGYSICANNLPLATATAVLARFGDGTPDGTAETRGAVMEGGENGPTGTRPLWSPHAPRDADSRLSSADNARFTVCVRALVR